MNAYGSGWGAGYLTDPNSYVSNDPSYDPYSSNTPNSYVSTDPNYDPYSSGGSGLNWGNQSMWGSIINGIGSYAKASAEGDAMKENAKLDAKAQKELLEQQRQYKMEDRQYSQGAASNWKRYFGS